MYDNELMLPSFWSAMMKKLGRTIEKYFFLTGFWQLLKNYGEI